MFGRYTALGAASEIENVSHVFHRRAIGGVEFAKPRTQERRLAPSENVSAAGRCRERGNGSVSTAGWPIVGDLLIGVADEADKDLLRQELRHAPVEMEIDADLVLRSGFLKLYVKPPTPENSVRVSGFR